METRKRLIAVGRWRERGEWWKEREGTSQRTCMNGSWAWTMERRLTVGERGGLGGGWQKGKKRNWDNCNIINNKNNKKELIQLNAKTPTPKRNTKNTSI